MNKYTIIKPFSLHDGLLLLSKDQARRRKHCLRHVDGDVYEIVKPVSFKGGEEIGHDGDIPKTLMSNIMPLVDDEPDEPDDDEVTIEEIMTAIADLGTENPAHFTNDGKPKVPSIVEILDKDISAAQRDEAWELMQADD